MTSLTKPRTAATLAAEFNTETIARRVYAEKIAEQSYVCICAKLDAAVPTYTLDRVHGDLQVAMDIDIEHERAHMRTFDRDRYFTVLNALVMQRGFKQLTFPRWEQLETTQTYHWFRFGPFTELTVRKRCVAVHLLFAPRDTEPAAPALRITADGSK